jgi:hypothetical protein
MKNLSLTLATKPKALIILVCTALLSIAGYVHDNESLIGPKDYAILLYPILGALLGFFVGLIMDGWLRSYAWRVGINDAQKPSAIRLYLDLSLADGSSDSAEFANLPELLPVFKSKAKGLSTEEALADLKNHLEPNAKALIAHHFNLIIHADGVTDVGETEMCQKFREGIGIGTC